MQPEMWKPPVELSQQEEQIVKKIRKAKLFVFLREHRHELLDEAVQQELANLYRPAERGQPPIAPAMLALALILQAYMGISDDEVIEATLMDRRWQLVLDCLDTEQAPFSKGTLVAFRQRLIEAQMDRRLIERTIEIASHSQGFGPRALRAALDSSPVWGAGRVEDTYNLVGHALSKVMRVVADRASAGAGRSGQRGRSRSGVCDEPESGVGPRLGPGGAARRGAGAGPGRVAGRGKVGADPATGRGATGAAGPGDCQTSPSARRRDQGS